LPARTQIFGVLNPTKAEFKECPRCGRAFLPGSEKREFRDPQCATKARQRRWKREKAREGDITDRDGSTFLLERIGALFPSLSHLWLDKVHKGKGRVEKISKGEGDGQVAVPFG
jgi:hypothetical protein